MSRKTKTQPPLDDEELAAVLSRAARSLGWLLPETAEEVEAWEREEASLRNAEAPVDSARAVTKFRTPEPSTQTAIEEHLARAAREGAGEIPDDIEERMRRDREKAERDQS